MYTELDIAQVDANSILDEPLFVAIKDNFDFLKAKTDGIPASATSGLESTGGIDTEHDVSVAPGAARDSTDASTFVLAAALIKQLDFRWVAGDNAGGLANAAVVVADITVSFDNATSKMLGVGLFAGVANGDTVIIAGSAANSGNHEVTAATANDVTFSVAPVTEAAGQAITVYIVKANWLYNIYLADDGAGGVVIGFDDSNTAANFLAIPGVGTEFRAIGYLDTDATANISVIVSLSDRSRTRYYTITGANTWRKPAMLFGAFWRANAGGGGGEDEVVANTGAGGSAGTYGELWTVAADLGLTEVLTVGAGGAAETNGGVTSVGAHMSCPGGLWPSLTNQGAPSPAAATGTDLTIRGQAGTRGSNTVEGEFGQGGDSMFGHGGTRRHIITNVNSSGHGYGSGGAGGTGAVAWSGADGIIIVEEIYA